MEKKQIMKNINKSIFGVVLAGLTAATMTSCIEDVEPRSGTATADMVAKSPTATNALVNGLPAYGKVVWGDGHWSYGTPALMRIRDVMADDYVVVDHDYNQFSIWASTDVLGPSYAVAQFVQSYYYRYILLANTVIGRVDPAKAEPKDLGFLGIGYAYRAAEYLDMARMYEFKNNEIFPNGKNDQGQVVTGLTCPIVTDTLAEKSARNNPRATHEQMFKFIESDLNNAEKYIVNSDDNKANTLPTLAVVYGLKARLYLWNEDYAKAKEYARKAINESGLRPMTEEEATNPRYGFNDITKWMWGGQYSTEDRAVKTGIVNFTSFACNETVFGYAGNGPMNMIGKSFYDKLSDTDWRKAMWKAPADKPELAKKNKYVHPAFANRLPVYGSLKFRPNKGDFQNSNVAVVSAYPLMRVEEMYLIEAEAAEHIAAGTGIELLNKFMKTRDAKYKFEAKSQKENIDEIMFQKRIELWGEGISFYDIKRLDIPVTRGYAGTNFFDEWRFNTTGRPAWMNFCLVNLEENDNPAVAGWNNPDPSRKYGLWKDPNPSPF